MIFTLTGYDTTSSIPSENSLGNTLFDDYIHRNMKLSNSQGVPRFVTRL